MVRASGCARFAYNWALKEWQQQYEAWKKDNNLQSLMTMRYVDNSIL
ncbi:MULTISPECIES: helix-turn-helix domain-containing protein [unclassified Bartonella]